MPDTVTFKAEPGFALSTTNRLTQDALLVEFGPDGTLTTSDPGIVATLDAHRDVSRAEKKKDPVGQAPAAERES